MIQPPSETIVTGAWIENAVKDFEGERDVEIRQMRFEARDGGNVYEAFVTARIGFRGVKNYHWIIKESPKRSVNYDPSVNILTLSLF